MLTAVDGGSDLPSNEVIACVARSFENLSFPSPEGGMVTVTYPIMFAPDAETAGKFSPPPPPVRVPTAFGKAVASSEPLYPEP